MKKKEFDCVEMMHQGAKRIQENLKGMTLEQEMAYWAKANREFQRRHRALRKKVAAKAE